MPFPTATKLPHICTSHVYPPIPSRNHDWCAFFESDVESPSRYGWGPTKALAIRDLADTQTDPLLEQRASLYSELAQWRAIDPPTWAQEAQIDRIHESIRPIDDKLLALDAAQAPE
jgi:hypothetical protein